MIARERMSRKLKSQPAIAEGRLQLCADLAGEDIGRCVRIAKLHHADDLRGSPRRARMVGLFRR